MHITRFIVDLQFDLAAFNSSAAMEELDFQPASAVNKGVRSLLPGRCFAQKTPDPFIDNQSRGGGRAWNALHALT